MPPRRARRRPLVRPPSARRLTAAVTLAAVLLCQLPPPAVGTTVNGAKDRTAPFPCLDRPCGCATAAGCWERCCCFTHAQKLAWADANGVTAPANYAACAGSGPNRPGEADDGAFAEEADGMFNSLIPRPPAWCRDGLSNTVIVGERTLGAGGPDAPAGAEPPDPQCSMALVLPPTNVTETNCLLNTPPGAEPAGTNRFVASRGRIWAGQAFENTQYNHALPPNGERFDCYFWVSRGLMAARSFHPGGVNVAPGDGSARFVAETVNLDTWRAVGSANGGEVPDEAF